MLSVTQLSKCRYVVIAAAIAALVTFAFSERAVVFLQAANGESRSEANKDSHRDQNKPSHERRRSAYNVGPGITGKVLFGEALNLGFNNAPTATYELDPSGSLQRSTIANIDDMEGSYSPDYSKIVFVSRRDGKDDQNPVDINNREIYIMNADGTDQRRLTFNNLPEAQPAFSPDGTKIVYVSYDEFGNSGIYSMDADGSDQMLLNDGGSCLFSGAEKARPKRVRTPRDGYYPGIIGFDTPDYSPDGSRIIFGNGGTVYVMNPDGTGCSTLFTSNESYIPPEARFSPDGTKIAISDLETQIDPNTNQEIQVRFIRILDAAGNSIGTIYPFQFWQSPVWSPDGTRLAFFGGDDSYGGAYQISRIDADGFNQQQIYFATQTGILFGIAWGIPPAQHPPLTLRINQPHPFHAGTSGHGTVRLDPALVPTGGANVTLSIADGSTAISLPNTNIFIPEGSSEAVFQIDSAVNPNYGSADIIAQFGANSARATVSFKPSRPDLEVSNFSAPASVGTDQTFDISYTVTNIGAVSTGQGFGESVFLSTDDQLNVNQDTFIVDNFTATPLGPGAAISPVKTVSFPTSIIPSNGQYYLFVISNRNHAIDEGDNYANNVAVRTIDVALPDLVAQNLSVPSSTEPGVTYLISYDVTNQGGAVTNATSRSQVYFSPDGVAGNADDILLLTGLQSPVLNPGQTDSKSVNVTIPTTPVTPTGNAFFYVRVDYDDSVHEGQPAGTGETNNTTFGLTGFEYRVPDLQVTSTSSPPQVETDTPFALGWTDTNAGNRNAGAFVDRVYFSLDDQVGNDVLIGTFALAGGLAPATSVNRIQNVSIPTDSITQTGIYFIYVKTDDPPQIDEGVNEDNNVRFHPVTVTRLRRPDLEVTNITAPATAFFNQTVTVQWTVTNNGQGPTNTPQWKDRVFVGTSPTSIGGAIFLADSTSVSALNSGESYIASVNVKIPAGLTGAYYFHVVTDQFNNVNEENETNNLFSKAVTLNVPPLPDYVVESVQAPAQAFAGTPIQIDWTVRNQGNGSNERNSDGNFKGWRDRVYLSRDATLDPNNDRLLFTAGHGGELAPNQTYSANTLDTTRQVPQFVTLPYDIEGEWYVFVVTDAFNDIYEFTNETNNAGYDETQPGSPMNVLVAPPDLIVVGEANAPANAESGKFITVNYTSKNQGAFGVPGSFYDAIYLSADQTFDPSDTFLGRTPIRNGMPAGNESLIELNVRIPDCLSGTYYIFAVTDYTNLIFEFDPNVNAEANNASAPRQIELASNPPDLQVTDFQMPAVTQPGQQILISFTVTNTGSNPANGTWFDRIYLVSNSGLPTQYLYQVTHENGLAAGASYTINQTLGLPAFMNGEYYLTIQTDAGNAVPECGFEGNNTSNSTPFTVSNNLPDLIIDNVTVPPTAQIGTMINVQWTGHNIGQAMNPNSAGWQDRIFISTDSVLNTGDLPIGQELIAQVLAPGETYQRQKQVFVPNKPAGSYFILVAADAYNNIAEGLPGDQFESNNVKASIPISITAPGVDLQTSNVTVSTPVYSGRAVGVSWTVTNTGASTTLSTLWTDYVYLSRDTVLDANDSQLGFLNWTAGLSGGANYQQTKSFAIPNGLTGDYYVLVYADRSNLVAESDETNNIAAPFPVNVQLPPPADLNITNITAPATINLDNPAMISWTVQNSGPDVAIGAWRDSVYFSRDQFWDSGDTLVGIRDRGPSTVNVGETYTEFLNAFNIFVEEGDYYVIVRTDARNVVREANEANNVSTSVAPTTVEITQLTMNAPLNTTIVGNGRKVFKFGPPPGETLLVSLFGEQGSSNELFTKFNSIVSRADYDFQGTRPGEADQENVVPESGDGQYYSLVTNDFIPSSFGNDFRKAPDKTKQVPDAKPDETSLGSGQNITIKAEVLPFSVRSVSPDRAGNEGFTALEISGAKFQQGATVVLRAQDGSVVSTYRTAVTTNTIAAIFDLRGAAVGFYDVVVTNPDSQSAELQNAFEVIQGGGGYNLRTSVIDPGTQRSGAPRRIRLNIAANNDGMNDAFNVPVFIVVPANTPYELDRSNYIEPTPDSLPSPYTPETIPFHIDRDGFRFIALYCPAIKAGGNVRIGIELTLTSTTLVQTYVLPPMFAPDLVRQGNGNSFAGTISRNASYCWAEFLRRILFEILARRLGADCAAAMGKVLLEGGNIASDYLQRSFTGRGGFDGWSAFAGLALKAANASIECANAAFPEFGLVSDIWDIFQAIQYLQECLNFYPHQLIVKFAGAFDPNEKIGPDGWGPEKFVPVNQPLLYRINFENLSTATAPAQRIAITDTLPATLDPRTVRIREIGFKQYRYVVPDNQAFYQQRVQLDDDVGNLKADITAGLDLVNRRIFWVIQAIDPSTGEAPLGAEAGILPPNNENGDGEGYVTFTIEPTAGQPSRTEIINLASIVFDENEAIATNAATNLLDSGIPTSAVSPLPPTTVDPDIALQLSGQDDPTGTGLKGVDIYVSVDRGPFTLFRAETTGTSVLYSGNWGTNYRFYSIARDNAGNVESPPSVPDAEITTLGGNTESDLSPRPNGSDGTVDANDVGQSRRFAAKLDTDLQYNEFQRADTAPLAVGGDGSLSISDVIQTRRFADGLDPLAPALGPNTATLSSAKLKDGLRSNLLPREIRPVRIDRIADKLFVGIELESQGDEVGAGFTMTFDPAILSNPANISAGTDASGAAVTFNDSQANVGKLGVLIDKALNAPFAAGTRQILTIEFDIADGAPPMTVIGFDDSIVKSETADATASPLNMTFTSSMLSLLTPTAASVSVGGAVSSAQGARVARAKVTITDPDGVERSTLTNQFGKYRFYSVAVGRSYTVTVESKKFATQTRLVHVTDAIMDLNFLLE